MILFFKLWKEKVINFFKNYLITLIKSFGLFLNALGSLIINLLFVILFPILQFGASIYFISKYFFHHRKALEKWSDEKCLQCYNKIMASKKPTSYVCLGLRLDNKLTANYIIKRVKKLG